MHMLSIRKTAAKAIARLPPAIRTQIVAELEALAAGPDDPALDVEPIVGTEFLRLKFHNPARSFRAIFVRDDADATISVRSIEPRGQAYDVRRLQR